MPTTHTAATLTSDDRRSLERAFGTATARAIAALDGTAPLAPVVTYATLLTDDIHDPPPSLLADLVRAAHELHREFHPVGALLGREVAAIHRRQLAAVRARLDATTDTTRTERLAALLATLQLGRSAPDRAGDHDVGALYELALRARGDTALHAWTRTGGAGQQATRRWADAQDRLGRILAGELPDPPATSQLTAGQVALLAYWPAPPAWPAVRLTGGFDNAHTLLCHLDARRLTGELYLLDVPAELADELAADGPGPGRRQGWSTVVTGPVDAALWPVVAVLLRDRRFTVGGLASAVADAAALTHGR